MAKVIISLPDVLLEEIDRFSESNSYNRSEFFRHAARKIIQLESNVQESIVKNKNASETI